MSGGLKPIIHNPVMEDAALVALASTRTKEDAVAVLKEQGYMVTVAGLKHIAAQRAERLTEVRAEITPRLERELTDNMLDTARIGQIAIATAVAKTQERLDKGIERDPAKVARDLADVVSKSVHNKLALEGRPTHVTEVRDVAQIVAALERKGIIDSTCDESDESD